MTGVGVGGVMNKWTLADRSKPPEHEKIDLWLYIPATARSMGFSDAFKVEQAWRENGKWFHIYKGTPAELQGDYVTHWSALPSPTKAPKAPTIGLW